MQRKCSMDFIAKYHGAIISFLVGNGNMYSYKHNGVEHHLIVIRMLPLPKQLTHKCLFALPIALSNQDSLILTGLLLPSSSMINLIFIS